MKKTMTYVSSLFVAGALLLSSCSTYNKLALQWKYRADYKNPNQTGFTFNSNTSESVLSAATTTETAVSENNALASTSNEVITKREIRTAVKTAVKNSGVSKREIFSAIKAAKNMGPNGEKIEGKVNGGFDKTIALVLALLFLVAWCGIHRIYMYIVAKQSKDLLIGLLQFFYIWLFRYLPNHRYYPLIDRRFEKIILKIYYTKEAELYLSLFF